MSRGLPVLIAGGGIGGLATALGLAQKGIRSILLEKAAALGEIGVAMRQAHAAALETAKVRQA